MTRSTHHPWLNRFAWFAIIFLQAALGAATVLSNKAADVATARVLLGALSLLTGAILSWTVLSQKERLGVTTDRMDPQIFQQQLHLRHLQQKPVSPKMRTVELVDDARLGGCNVFNQALPLKPNPPLLGSQPLFMKRYHRWVRRM